MTSAQRREQLIAVGRTLFAQDGYEAVSMERIASTAKISKPIVYEHFGGKEGLYAVIVDREMQKLTKALMDSLSDATAHPRLLLERATLAFLTYIEEDSNGFQVLVRDSPSTDSTGSFNSFLGDVSIRIEHILKKTFKQHGIPTKSAPYYAQMLVGTIVFTGQYWANHRKASKEQLAAYIVNLVWKGLSRMDAKPVLVFNHSDAPEENNSETDDIPYAEGSDASDSNNEDSTAADDAEANSAEVGSAETSAPAERNGDPSNDNPSNSNPSTEESED